LWDFSFYITIREMTPDSEPNTV